MFDFKLNLTKGIEVHNQLGISDERFEELGNQVCALMEEAWESDDPNSTINLIAQVAAIPQTPGEVACVYLQVGGFLRDVDEMRNGSKEINVVVLKPNVDLTSSEN